jgi:hypothetical protein
MTPKLLAASSSFDFTKLNHVYGEIGSLKKQLAERKKGVLSSDNILVKPF